jgi:hypothetical protein
VLNSVRVGPLDSTAWHASFGTASFAMFQRLAKPANSRCAQGEKFRGKTRLLQQLGTASSRGLFAACQFEKMWLDVNGGWARPVNQKCRGESEVESRLSGDSLPLSLCVSLIVSKRYPKTKKQTIDRAHRQQTRKANKETGLPRAGVGFQGLCYCACH